MSDEYLLRDENGKVLGEVQLPKHVLFIHEMEENVVRKYFRDRREKALEEFREKKGDEKKDGV